MKEFYKNTYNVFLSSNRWEPVRRKNQKSGDVPSIYDKNEAGALHAASKECKAGKLKKIKF